MSDADHNPSPLQPSSGQSSPSQPSAGQPSIGQPSRRGFLAGAGLLAAAAMAGKLPGSASAAVASSTSGAATDAARGQPIDLAGTGGLKPTGDAPKAKARVPLAEGEVIKMAVIGTGGMGTGHCEAFTTLAGKGLDKVQIVALSDVCDSHLGRAKDKVEKAQGNKVETFRDYKKLLERSDIHGVLIASPEHWHAQMAIDALLAGKDVYLEKPMTLRLGDALRLREVVKANPDLRLQVGTQMTNMPKFHEARKVIESGMLGKPLWAQTSYCRNSKDGEWNYYGIDKNWEPGKNLDWEKWCGPMGSQAWDPKIFARWRRYRAFSTGILGDLLVHVMTPMLVAVGQHAGWPKKVTAVGGHYVDKAMENHDQVNLSIEFENDFTLIVAGSTCNEAGLETMIRANKGNIYLNSRNCIVRPEATYSSEVDEKKIDCADIGNDQDVHRLKWLKCIRTREQPDSDVDQGAKVMVMVDLATRALWEGSSYEFDSKTMSVRRL